MNTPDGEVLLYSAGPGEGANLRCWNAKTGEPVWRAGDFFSSYECNGIASLVQRGSRVVVATATDSGVFRWEAANGRRLDTSIDAPNMHFWGICGGVSRRGQAMLVAAGHDGMVYRLDPADGRLFGAPLKGHEGSVMSVAFGALPDGTHLIASGDDTGTVMFWEADSGSAVNTPVIVGGDAVRNLAFCHVGQRAAIAAVDIEGQIHCRDILTSEPLGPVIQVDAVVTSLATPQTWGQIITACDDEVLRQWDLASGELVDDSLVGISASSAPLGDGMSVLAVGTLAGDILVKSR
ncbi:WD40 repeat domain-containing protein [Streptacidiphilus sp. MAP5-52]